MDDLRVGEWVRSERRRLGLRQADLAGLAGVSAQTVLRVEHGRLSQLALGRLRAVAAAVAIQLPLAPRSLRGAALERQVDARHAALVEAVVAFLSSRGWQVLVEYSFNVYGDRGSVDALGWHAETRSLLIAEIKSELRDVQQTLRALDVKRRIVPALLRSEKGWRPESFATLLVVADLRVERNRVARHGDTFGVVLPARTVEVKRWVKEPRGDVRGVWFLQIPHRVLPMRGATWKERVRRPQSGANGPDSSRRERGSGRCNGVAENGHLAGGPE